MIKLTYYEVYDHYGVDGREPISIIGRFTNQEDAVKFAVGQGNYKQDAQTMKVHLIIAETYEEAPAIKEEESRLRALSKLTLEERKLLGLV